jgi:hypothetical protein
MWGCFFGVGLSNIREKKRKKGPATAKKKNWVFGCCRRRRRRRRRRTYLELPLGLYLYCCC